MKILRIARHKFRFPRFLFNESVDIEITYAQRHNGEEENSDLQGGGGGGGGFHGNETALALDVHGGPGGPATDLEIDDDVALRAFVVAMSIITTPSESYMQMTRYRSENDGFLMEHWIARLGDPQHEKDSPAIRVKYFLPSKMIDSIQNCVPSPHYVREDEFHGTFVSAFELGGGTSFRIVKWDRFGEQPSQQQVPKKPTLLNWFTRRDMDVDFPLNSMRDPMDGSIRMQSEVAKPSMPGNNGGGNNNGGTVTCHVLDVEGFLMQILPKQLGFTSVRVGAKSMRVYEAHVDFDNFEFTKPNQGNVGYLVDYHAKFARWVTSESFEFVVLCQVQSQNERDASIIAMIVLISVNRGYRVLSMMKSVVHCNTSGRRDANEGYSLNRKCLKIVQDRLCGRCVRGKCFVDNTNILQLISLQRLTNLEMPFELVEG